MRKKLLYLLIILCPILDIMSFLFRQHTGLNYSPATVIRPIIPIILTIYIFFKDKIKLKLILGFIIYAAYGAIHLILYKYQVTESSYGGVMKEAQYIINYSFLILNLFLYLYVFKNENKENLKKSVFIAMLIYIVSIYIAIITKTSSATYVLEGIGFKGWIESGNSISAICVLSLFILLPQIKSKKILAVIILIGIFLTYLIGTRVGLFGFILAICLYVFSYIFVSFFKKIKLNKIYIFLSIIIIAVIVIAITAIGSKTLERRKHLHEIENNITENGNIAHISGDLLSLKEKIEKNELSIKEMTLPRQQAIISLYNYANKHNIVNNDMRKQQLIYNTYLIKHQKSLSLSLFGNGYQVNFRELVFEMEFIAILFNFGIIGFILYLGPFIAIFLYSLYMLLKNIKSSSIEQIMLLFGLFLSFVLSVLSGYTFFNSSTMIFIIIISTLNLYNKNKIKNGVVFGITGLTLGGAERVLVDVANELSNKYDITIFTIYSGGELEKQLSSKVNLKSLYKKSYNQLNKIQKLIVPIYIFLNKKFIYNDNIRDKYNLEIAFLEGAITNLFSVENTNNKKIAWIHNDISLVFGTGKKAKIKRYLNKSVYEKYSKLIFVSQDNLENFNKTYNIKTEKEVINNYIESQTVIDSSLKDNADEIQENIESFLTISRLVEQKAIERLVKVHKKLIEDNKYHKIYIIGDGPLRAKIETLIKQLKVEETFLLLGKKENPYPYLLKCKYFSLLSYFEGFPMVLEEAKILNKNIIITDTAARETLCNYKNKIIVENSEDGIYDGMSKILQKTFEFTEIDKNEKYDNKYIIERIDELLGENI